MLVKGKIPNSEPIINIGLVLPDDQIKETRGTSKVAQLAPDGKHHQTSEEPESTGSAWQASKVAVSHGLQRADLCDECTWCCHQCTNHAQKDTIWLKSTWKHKGAIGKIAWGFA